MMTTTNKISKGQGNSDVFTLIIIVIGIYESNSVFILQVMTRRL